MSLLDGLIVSVFGLGTVFIALIALSGIVSLESKVFEFFGKNRKESPAEDKIVENSENAPVVNTSSGQLKLIDVDERTAAMIMAIVSHESQIPLSELNFKYIRAID